MTIVAVIPARYESSRFPGKPLANETGRYLIQHVYERVSQCPQIDRVVVATDDERIAAAVRSFDGDVKITSKQHPTGTHRVAEVAGLLQLQDDDIVVNVQGDEPEVDPADLTDLIARLESVRTCTIATLAARFDEDGPKSGPGSPLDPNCVKVVVNDAWQAMYFSRSLVPYPRSGEGAVDKPSHWLLHLGLYAFRAEALAAVASLPVSPREGSDIIESLEQLRWLAAGFTIGVGLASHASIGIDTPADYDEFVTRWNNQAGK